MMNKLFPIMNILPRNFFVQPCRTKTNVRRHRKPKSWEDPWNPYLGKGGRYSPRYIVPIFDEEVQRNLPPEVRERPVKAATINDPVTFYHHPVVNKFINIIMVGSKVAGRKIVENMFYEIKKVQVKKYWQASEEERKSIETDPMKIFLKAVENATPLIGTVPVWRLGTTHQVPIVLKDSTKLFLTLRWLKLHAREKNVRTGMHESLCREVLQMYNNEGAVIQKRNDLHRLAENNKSYVQLRRNAVF